MLLKVFHVSGHIVPLYLRSHKLETAVIHKWLELEGKMG